MVMGSQVTLCSFILRGTALFPSMSVATAYTYYMNETLYINQSTLLFEIAKKKKHFLKVLKVYSGPTYYITKH